MSGSQNKPARAASARPAPMRPTSSKNRKLHQKTEFIDNVYGQNNANDSSGNYHSFQKNKTTANKFNQLGFELEDLSRLVPKPDQMNKEKEQLFQENLHLKKEINKMREEMNKNRTKIEMLTSKSSKYTKQFNRQFEKKMYWTGNNAYLISGIKAQYEKLKEELSQRNQQCEILKKQLVQSRAPQFKILAQTLQEQNRKLSQRVHKMAEVSQQVLFDNAGSKNVPQYVYNDLEVKYQKLDEKLRQSQYDTKVSKQQCKDLQKKIEFLQKLIIEKDNAQYHASKKAKKADKQKVSLEQKIKNLEAVKSDESRNYQAKIQKIKTMEQKRFKAEKDMFDRTIHEKDQRIQKLQKQVAYLSTLLTYWKPLDQLNREDIENKYNQSESESIQLKKKEPEKGNKKKDDEKLFVLDNKSSQVAKPRRATEFQIKGDFLLKSSVELPNGIRQSQKPSRVRVQQTADKRHHETAQKKRKVDYKQVQHLGEHLKYRFLGLRLGMNQVKKYFDYRKQSTNPEAAFVLNDSKLSKQQDNTWDEQYMSMREAKQILQAYPFELHQDQAHLLSRYLIEDSLNEFVYVDENNEHKRSIIKSIVKALVGSYEILEGERQLQIEKQCKQMLDKYQTNLLSALSTMASSGFISRRKFLELLSSLGIELSEEGKDYLVCKMLLKSESLNKLSYMIILD